MVNNNYNNKPSAENDRWILQKISAHLNSKHILLTEKINSKTIKEIQHHQKFMSITDTAINECIVIMGKEHHIKKQINKLLTPVNLSISIGISRKHDMETILLVLSIILHELENKNFRKRYITIFGNTVETLLAAIKETDAIITFNNKYSTKYNIEFFNINILPILTIQDRYYHNTGCKINIEWFKNLFDLSK